MAGGYGACPFCGEDKGPGLSNHVRYKHPDQFDEWREVKDEVTPPPPQQELWSEDGQPQPTKKKAAPKTPRRPASKGIPLSVQLQLPYQLLSNATATRLPATSRVLAVQAKPCAEAWDQFLMRYPALREKIEQGMIAGDVVALIMAHVPILTAAREEIAARQAAAMQYADGQQFAPA